MMILSGYFGRALIDAILPHNARCIVMVKTLSDRSGIPLVKTICHCRQQIWAHSDASKQGAKKKKHLAVAAK
jgi:hypothetical protein